MLLLDTSLLDQSDVFLQVEIQQFIYIYIINFKNAGNNTLLRLLGKLMSFSKCKNQFCSKFNWQDPNFQLGLY